MHESDKDDRIEEEEVERPVKKRKAKSRHLTRKKGPSGPQACREQGCDKWALTGGLCIAHRGVSAQKPCSMEGCGTLAYSKGLCYKHGGGKPCSVEGCGTLAHGKGLCFKHGGRTQKP